MAEDLSKVSVVFNDGSFQDYLMSAGTGIGTYLSDQAGRTGILFIRNGEENYSIPVRNIREWKISSLPKDEVNGNPNGTADA